MADGSHEALQAPADPTPVVSLYEDGTLAKAEAAFQAELQKPLASIPKDDPVAAALLKEYPKPELGAIAPPTDTVKSIEATPTSFASPGAKPTELPALPIPASPLPADLTDPRVNLGLPQTADLAPPAPAGSRTGPEFAVVRHDPPLVLPADEISHPKLSPQTDPPPLHGTTTPTEPPGFPGAVTPPPALVPSVTPQA